MVDFSKQLSTAKVERSVDPVRIYDTLDRASDKGPLRPAQVAVLTEWFSERRASRDVIIKLHTGQGKTLVGLLMLQSQLTSGKGPAVYLCPDNYLIAQTCTQAKQFGISTCRADPDLPEEFINSNKILVTSVQKLFNGLTKFGLAHKSITVGTLLMDDAHACSDIVREACRIRIPSDDSAYSTVREIFAEDLSSQGLGTYADICNGARDSILPVPYWAWMAKVGEVSRILSKASARIPFKFAWPILKDMLVQCQCIVSGAAIEIEPFIPPVQVFGSYARAAHRIFMSATVTDDSFLVKGLGLGPEVIANPLTDPNERWSGEKMILLPTLLNDELDRSKIVAHYAPRNASRRYGVVGLTPGFAWTRDWAALGAKIAQADTLESSIDVLRTGNFESTLVLVNRYDGVDLPDDACRILIFDSKPYSESLIDLYQESVRPHSVATLMRVLRTVEQGTGRSVRGEKDFSVVILVGSDLTRLMRDKGSQQYLSAQMAKQIEIGLEIVDLGRQEIKEGKSPIDVLGDLVRQCIGRDSSWKDFYIDRMSHVKPMGPDGRILRLYAKELEAERLFQAGDYDTAVTKLQDILDSEELDEDDRGWYLQEIARYLFRTNRVSSQQKQIAAHGKNRLLLKPAEGVTVAQLKLISQGRMERIAKWVSDFERYADLDVALSDILNGLVFGTKADRFEQSLDRLSFALGLVGERPDKEWKEGPDNLWALNTFQYLLWECKSEVDLDRKEISKHEAEQMNRSSAWFEKHYPNMEVRRLIIHPSHIESSAAAFTHDVESMRGPELKRLTANVRAFFKSFENLNFKDLSISHIQQLASLNHLSENALMNEYGKKIRKSR